MVAQVYIVRLRFTGELLGYGDSHVEIGHITKSQMYRIDIHRILESCIGI